MIVVEARHAHANFCYCQCHLLGENCGDESFICFFFLIID
jgi:hypothetical protein